MAHIPFKHKRTTLERAEKFISEHYFTDINLHNRVYPEKAALASLLHLAVSGRPSYQEVLAKSQDWEPCSIGDSFGPVWSTHWFKLSLVIPFAWKDYEVHLLFDTGSEAMVFEEGEPRQGLSGDNGRISYPLDSSKAGETQTLYVEMACNTRFGIGACATQRESDLAKMYALSQATMALCDKDIRALKMDVQLLHDIVKELPDDNQRGYQGLYTVNQMINIVDFENRNSIIKAREIAKSFFNQKNGESQHTLYAMGHAHIDSAWLWPYAETQRKCARSWSCTLRLMEKYPNFKFMCSQAQQYDWVKTMYPGMWKDICKFVQNGQFVPVGGTWIEMDGNIPSGEACIRQFLYGQQFFMKEFGVHCKEFWLPDTFGYSAQFPQIMQHCGVTRFLTQKLSWSLVNKFPHHTFDWEGLDGSRVLAHFPPGDSYEMEGQVRELLKSVNNFCDKGRSNASMYLFGYGDGGHGPSQDMLERIDRLQDCDGLPKITMSTSDEFFSAIEAEREALKVKGQESGLLCRWRGELYLELHNGTYTTWAKVKLLNRQCEGWLRELELLATAAALRDPEYSYPKKELERLWKLLLLNQFHDVLPGTSITQVYTDAMEYFDDIKKSVNTLINQAAGVCAGHNASSDQSTYVVNTQPFPRHEVIAVIDNGDGLHPETADHCLPSDVTLVEVEVPPLAVTPLVQCERGRQPAEKGSVQRQDVGLSHEKNGITVLDNGLLRALVDGCGRVVSLKIYNKKTCRLSKEAVLPGCPMNQFVLYDDVPLYWDAWDVMDYHLETRKPVGEPISQTSSSNPLQAKVETVLEISPNNRLIQTLSLDAGSPYLRVDVTASWKQNRKCLKVEFPSTIHTTEASYDIQSGFLTRPNHYNTSWDTARFEVCGHKWADLSEFDFGVSILNNCKYGWSAVDGTLRLTLLRSPKNPDPEADMGEHNFSYAIMPHSGSLQSAGTIEAAHAFNNPLRLCQGPQSEGRSLELLLSLDTQQVTLQAVKMAEDESGDVIVRLHEAWGGAVTANLTALFPLSSISLCDGLERPLDKIKEASVLDKIEAHDAKTSVTLNLGPFQIVSLRMSSNQTKK